MVSLGRRMAVVCAMLATAAGGISSCLNRPVTTTEPETSNMFVDLTTQRRIDKIDLLFMIDNSASMSDKQEMLKLAVPQLLGRLIHPWCRSPSGGSVPPADGVCPDGFEPEFDPVDDIHIGVISSSLGSPQAEACSEWVTHGDDAGHLIGLKRQRADGSALETYQGLGFLAWDPKGKKVAQGLPAGETDAARLIAQFQELVVATGETGCGYEASLEAWYRFLIDPAPPARWVVENNVARPDGVDTALLEERRQFLRPDSLVAIVMLSDENDCSLDFRGDGWRIAAADQGDLPRGTSACASEPNSPCCRSCGPEPNGPPAGCEAAANDPACAGGGSHSDATDPRNLRCHEQKRRFGASRLFPVQRYIDALKLPTVVAYDGSEHPNPLFTDLNSGAPASRTQDLVFLTGIVGVPWQDIATSDSLGAGNENVLRYQDAKSLAQNQVWSLVLGDTTRGVPAADPLMRESVEPRQGTTPGLASLAPPESAPFANPVNGHEYYPRGSADLQYSCIFPLEAPLPCGDDQSCDCDDSAATLTPLCQEPDGSYGDTQLYAKAYPGLRHLEVLQGAGESGIMASICPKLLPTAGDATTPDPNVGYNPAVDALITVVGSKLGGKCVPRQLAPDTMTGRVPCAMVEVLPADAQGQCEPCASVAGRLDPTPKVVRSVHRELRSTGRCTTPDCAGTGLCEIEQAVGDELQACQQRADAR
ncbi:MAG TPA: hypothetical protein VI197_18160, partial [Polyangiaceae bacterium]